MDAYSVFAAIMSKIKNPINDVGVTTVYGIDDPEGLVSGTSLTYLGEREMTPDRFADELQGMERKIFKKIYGGDGINVLPAAKKQIDALTALGYDKLPICVAKTQYSLSDDPTKLCRPTGFKLHVNTVRVSAGAGFVVALTGDIMTMPGLPKVPAAEKIDVDEAKLGLKGSPTKVFQSFPKAMKAPGEVHEVSEEEAVELIVNKLKEKHII